MPTIDSIKIGLGIDASQLAKDVAAANTSLDKLQKSRTTNLTVVASVGKSVETTIRAIETKLNKIREVEIGIKVNPEEIRAAQVRASIKKALAADGGIPIPITVNMNKSEAQTTRNAIRDAIGTVIINWAFAGQPTGGFPQPPSGGGGGATPTGPGGGTVPPAGGASVKKPRAPKGTGGGTAATPTAQAEPETPLAGTGRQRKTRQPKPARGAPATGGTGAPVVPQPIPTVQDRRVSGNPNWDTVGRQSQLRRSRFSQEPTNLARKAEEYVPGVGTFGIAAGEIPKTVNPKMRERIEALRQDENAAERKQWAEEMLRQGLDPTDAGDRRKFRATLTPQQNRRFGKTVGEALASLSVGDPDAINAALGIITGQAIRFGSEVEETKGGIVNLKSAGPRKGPQVNLTPADQSDVSRKMLQATAIKERRRTRKENKADATRLRAEMAAREQPEPDLLNRAERELADKRRLGEFYTGVSSTAEVIPDPITILDIAGPGMFANILDRGMYDPTFAEAQAAKVRAAKPVAAPAKPEPEKVSLEEVMRRRKLRGLAEGGLLKRMADRGDTRAQSMIGGLAVTRVGEQGDELIVTDRQGESEVIPHHKVPMWLQRASEGKGLTKDLTGRAPGGPIAFRGKTGFVPEPQPVVNAQGLVQRVYVVNWPGSLVAAAAAATAAGGGGFGTPTGSPFAGGAAQPQTPNPQAAAAGFPGLAGIATIKGTGRFKLPQSEVAASLIASRERSLATSKILSKASSDVSVALAESPVRAFAVGVSQVIATKFGRGELIERAKRAQLDVQVAKQAQADAERTRTQLDLDTKTYSALFKKQTLNKDELKQLQALHQSIPETTSALTELEGRAELLTKAAEVSSQGLTTVKDQFVNLGLSLGSILGAGIIFRAGVTAVSLFSETVANVVGDFVEQGTGFTNATASMTAELAKQTLANGGNAKAATAQALGQSRLNDATSAAIAPTLANRAAVMASNQALHLQTEQIAAFTNITKENTKTGLPPGFDANLVRGVGGPADLGLLPGILSQRSTADELSIRLRQAQPPIQKTFLNDLAPETERERIQLNAESADKLKNIIDSINNAGGQGLQVVDPDDPRVQQTIDAFKSLGDDAASQFAATLETDARAGRGIALGNGPINAFAATQFLKQQQTAALTPTPGQAISVLTAGKGPDNLSGLDVALRDINRRGAIQRQTLAPAATALQFAARPLISFNDTRLRPGGKGVVPGIPDAENVGAQYQAAFSKYSSVALPAQAAINKQITKGQETLAHWVPADLLANIKTLGTSIQDIQLDLGQRGLNLEVAEYNNQLRVARRSLKDAQDIQAGISGESKKTLGGMQGQNIALQRQLQLLGFALQQRQINFQLATAGFITSGDTPEQRAARIAEAKIEAGYAQEQLNLNKQIASNDFSITLQQTTRSITDLTKEIQNLETSKGLTIDSYAASLAIQNLEANLTILQDQAQSYYDQGVKQVDLLSSTITDIEAATGSVFANWQTDLVSAYEKAGKAAGAAATDFVVASIAAAFGLVSSGDPAGLLGVGHHNAAGTLFNTTGPTSMVVGEAGTETVAVLRNPRNVTMGSMGGGGGNYINVTFTGAVTVRDDRDIDVITRKVVSSINNQVALLGLR